MTKRRRGLLLVVFSAFWLLATPALAQDFHGCPGEAKGGDPALNRLKNRTEVPASFESIDFEALADLVMPEGVGKKHRAQWSRATLASVEPQEKRAIQVVGYLLRVKLEGREATNCGSDAPEDRDFHVWLADSAGGGRFDAAGVAGAPRLPIQPSRLGLPNLNRNAQQ